MLRPVVLQTGQKPLTMDEAYWLIVKELRLSVRSGIMIDARKDPYPYQTSSDATATEVHTEDALAKAHALRAIADMLLFPASSKANSSGEIPYDATEILLSAASIARRSGLSTGDLSQHAREVHMLFEEALEQLEGEILLLVLSIPSPNEKKHGLKLIDQKTEALLAAFLVFDPNLYQMPKVSEFVSRRIGQLFEEGFNFFVLAGSPH